jgi:heat shock protein HslJ
MTFRSLRIASTLLCTLPLIWTACGGSDTPESTAPDTATPAAVAPAPSAATAAPEFTDTEWKLVAFERADGNAVSPDPTAVPTIRFNSRVSQDGATRMVGFGGCNPFFGDYTSDDDRSLSMPAPLGMTQVACPDPISSLETAVMKSLAGATSYSLDNGELTIHSTNGSLRFGGG